MGAWASRGDARQRGGYINPKKNASDAQNPLQNQRFWNGREAGWEQIWFQIGSPRGSFSATAFGSCFGTIFGPNMGCLESFLNDFWDENSLFHFGIQFSMSVRKNTKT